MCTSPPSNRMSPLSGECVPATHLTSVDFPAPLSPTRAMTSPRRTSKSTSDSACTEPNDFVMPRSWRSGVSSTVTRFLPHCRWRRPAGRLHRARVDLLAVLLVRADADVAPLQELVREEPRVVRLRDPDHGKRQRRLVRAAVLPDRGGLRRLALEEGNGSLGRSLRLVGH